MEFCKWYYQAQSQSLRFLDRDTFNFNRKSQPDTAILSKLVLSRRNKNLFCISQYFADPIPRNCETPEFRKFRETFAKSTGLIEIYVHAFDAPYVYVISDPVRLTFCQTRWCFTFCLTWVGVLWWPWPEPASDFVPSLTTKPFGPEWTWPTNGSVLGWWGQSFPGEHRSLGWPRLVSNLPSFSHPLFCSTGTSIRNLSEEIT